MRLYIPKNSFGRDILNGLLLGGILLILLIAGGLFLINRDFQDSLQTKQDLDRLSDHLQQLRSSLREQETGQRGFELTGQEEFLEPYLTGTLRFDVLVSAINSETEVPEKLLVALQEVIKRGLYWHTDYAEVQIKNKRADRGSGSLHELRQGKKLFDDFNGAADYAESLQQSAKESSFRDLQRKVSDKLILFGLSVILLIVAMVLFLTGRLRQDMDHLHALGESARAYANRQFDVPVPKRRKKDDLGRLIQNIDQMRGALKTKFGDMAQLADMDGLTGIPNRRHLNEQLAKMAAASKRQELPLSLILCDIDFFKRFNDDYGHQEGDRIIRHAAQVLIDGKMFSRMVSRYGGEEFCILLPGCELDVARIEAERLRALIMEQRLDPYTITMSFGVASLLPDDDDEGVELTRRADKALYYAKASGRNRVECQTD